MLDITHAGVTRITGSRVNAGHANSRYPRVRDIYFSVLDWHAYLDMVRKMENI